MTAYIVPLCSIIKYETSIYKILYVIYVVVVMDNVLYIKVKSVIHICTIFYLFRELWWAVWAPSFG